MIYSHILHFNTYYYKYGLVQIALEEWKVLMKTLSRITVFLLSMILIVSMAAAQISYCLHSTLMSPQHLSRLLENDEKLAELTGIMFNSLSASYADNEQETFLKQYAAKILKNADQAWVKSQIYITAKGLHQYMFSDASTLPTLDIIPLKKAISDLLVSDIMKSEQGRQRTEKIKTILSAINNRYFAKIITLGLNNQLVSMLLELTPIRSTGFDKATISEIIRIYISLSNENINLEQASISIAEQMTSDILRLNEIRDYIDLSLFMDKAFGELDPLKAIKDFISGVDNTAARTVNITLWCAILLLIIHKRFQFIRAIKSAAWCLLISELLLLSASAFIINRPLIARLLSHLYNARGSLSHLAAGYISLLIRDFGQYLALQSVIASLLCAILIFAASKFKFQDKKKKPLFLPRTKLSLGVLAFMLIFAVIGFVSLSNQYNTFKGSMAKLSQTDVSESIKKGLIEAGGMEFLNLVEKIK